ncbi:MAG: hypothetical protein AAB834_00610 [Patescibacteria group bacterium]
MSVITPVLKNKRLLVVAAIVVLLGGAWLVSRNAREEPQTPQLSEADKKFFSSKDKAKQASLNAVFGSVSFAYVAQGVSPPEASPEGWKTVLDAITITDSFIDPYTDSIYVFTDKKPDYGQIEYRPGFVCGDNNTVVAGESEQVLALRARFSDGIRCVGSRQF